MGLNIFLAFLLGNFATSEGTICPAGTYHVPALDACFFYSTKVMDWNNAEEVGGFIDCYYMTSSVKQPMHVHLFCIHIHLLCTVLC